MTGKNERPAFAGPRPIAPTDGPPPTQEPDCDQSTRIQWIEIEQLRRDEDMRKLEAEIEWRTHNPLEVPLVAPLPSRPALRPEAGLPPGLSLSSLGLGLRLLAPWAFAALLGAAALAARCGG